MSQPSRVFAYADQLADAQRAAERAIAKPSVNVAKVSGEMTAKTPVLNLQKRIAAEYTQATGQGKNRERVIQGLGVCLIMLACWGIGFSLYSYI